MKEMQINNDLLNIATPFGGMEFFRDKVLFGNVWGSTYAMIHYPNNVSYGWLSRITNMIDAVNEGDIPKAIDRTWDFVTAIVPESREKVWENGEKSIMAGAILSTVFDNKEYPDCQNLSTVYSFINQMSGMNPYTEEMYLKSYVDSLADGHPAKEIYGVAVNAPSKQRMSCWQT